METNNLETHLDSLETSLQELKRIQEVLQKEMEQIEITKVKVNKIKTCQETINQKLVEENQRLVNENKNLKAAAQELNNEIKQCRQNKCNKHNCEWKCRYERSSEDDWASQMRSLGKNFYGE